MTPSVIQKNIEDAKSLVESVEKIRNWGAANVTRKLLTISIAACLLFGAQYFYVNDLIKKIEKNDKSEQIQKDFLTKSNLYTTTAERLDLCLGSKGKLKPYYCKIAFDNFSEYDEMVNKSIYSELIAKKAYGGMKLEMSKKLRNLEINKITNREMTAEEKQLRIILQGTSIASILFAVLSLFTLFVYWIYRQPKQNKTEEDIRNLLIPDEAQRKEIIKNHNKNK